ncbi:UNVERIFIED_CONTAM: hypothetical protein Sradi_7293100 [Sesamum radiatum]|uniref:Uncharacterized protein n=1 Tax=Sesamum radiatum TaxID=300843 RepID=A0AAW2IIV1_SESRA
MGYAETTYALRFLVIKSEIPGIEVNSIIKFCNTVFIKDVFPMKTGIPSSVSLDDSLASTSISEHVEKMSNVGVNPSSTSLTHEEPDEPRRSKRARVVKDFESDFVTYNIYDDPITLRNAMASSIAKQWKEAVKSEMDSIVSNETWELLDLPQGCTTIGFSRFTRWMSKHPSCMVNSSRKYTWISMKDLWLMITNAKFVNLSLQYLANGTGLDIFFSVSKLARFSSCPDRTHWGALDRVLRYLKDTVSLAINYGRFPAVLEGYNDASWIAKNSSSNGCSGYVFTLDGGAIS